MSLFGVSSESAGAQPPVAAVPAGSQTGAPGVPGAPAGPQAGAATVPGASAGPQAGSSSVPAAPAGAQSGAPAVPGAPAAAQVGLLGTTLAKVVLAVVVAVTVIGAAGAAYVITRGSSQARSSGPTLTVQSAYHQGGIPAGSITTTLQAQGQRFSKNAAITLLLDGQPVPGAASVQSDASGAFQANLAITKAWSLGAHTLTARDASGNAAQQGVIIVAQGEANTPGPNGAPPDDASFVLTSVDPSYFSNHLMITGHPDPAGGKPCYARDTGQPQMFSYNAGESAKETWTCSGSYKGGKLTFAETLVSAEFDGPSYMCVVTNTPLVDMQLNGTFTTATTISGTYSTNYNFMLHCTGTGDPGRGGGPPTGPWTAMITTGP